MVIRFIKNGLKSIENGFELLEQKLDKESLKDFYEALQNKNIAVPVLVKALSELGIEVSVSVIQRWRKNDKIPNTMRRRKAK